MTLTLNCTLIFWEKISQSLRSLPSLKLGYLPKSIANCNGLIKFDVEKVHLVLSSPNIERISMKFVGLKELTLSGNVKNRDLMTMWIDYATENQRIEKLKFFIPHWFDQNQLTKILKNLKHLSHLTIFDCNISMASIVQALFISQSIEKLHLVKPLKRLNCLDG